MSKETIDEIGYFKWEWSDIRSGHTSYFLTFRQRAGYNKRYAVGVLCMRWLSCTWLLKLTVKDEHHD